MTRRRGGRTAATASAAAGTPLLLSSLLLFGTTTIVLISPVCHAERDGNAPWGDGSPPRGFEMWWRDPSNVLEDLDQFASLYIKVHGCVWSEYGIDNFDDDGENRDGDEVWYQGRTQPFRANAAYSLYGVLKGHYKMFGHCTKGTYINTFVTNMGADTILNILGRDTGLDATYDYGGDDANGNNYNGNDDYNSGSYGHAYCYEYVEDDWRRDLGSGDNNDDSYISTTMGCSLTSNDFVMATFQDAYCDGNYFLNTTDTMPAYNRQMNRIKCAKIWDYKNNFNSEAAGDELLQYSSACENDFYQNRCPDPYGKKRKYALMVSGQGRYRRSQRFQRFVRVVSWMVLSAGLALASVGLFLRCRYYRKSLWNRRSRLLGGKGSRSGSKKSKGHRSRRSSKSVRSSPSRSSPSRSSRSSKRKSRIVPRLRSRSTSTDMSEGVESKRSRTGSRVDLEMASQEGGGGGGGDYAEMQEETQNQSKEEVRVGQTSQKSSDLQHKTGLKKEKKKKKKKSKIRSEMFKDFM